MSEEGVDNMDLVIVDDLAIKQRGNGSNALHYARAASDGTTSHPSSKTRMDRTTAIRKEHVQCTAWYVAQAHSLDTRGRRAINHCGQ